MPNSWEGLPANTGNHLQPSKCAVVGWAAVEFAGHQSGVVGAVAVEASGTLPAAAL